MRCVIQVEFAEFSEVRGGDTLRLSLQISQHATMNFPKSRFFTHRHGFRQAYIDVGRGAPIVCVHGNPSWSYYFHSLIAAFAKSHRVIAPDHIGMGRSDNPPPDQYDWHFASRVADLEALLEHLALDQPITLVVHDWGGMIGLSYALRFPERIARLVITNTAAFPLLKGKQLPWQISLVRNTAMGAWAADRLNAFALGAAYLGVVRPLASEQRQMLLAPYRERERRRGVVAFVRDIPIHATDRGHDELVHCEHHLHQLAKLPTLLLWGLKDFVFDRDYLDAFKSHFPDAHCVAFEDAGHYVLLDQPEASVQAIRKHLEA
jgi:haloalkane dehalogenase